MRKKIPQYSGAGLQIALDSKLIFPANMNELDFQYQIQSNEKILWDVNPFAFEEDCIRVLLDASNFNRWKMLPRIGQIIGTFIAYWCLRTWTLEMLLLLLILPFAIGALPNLLFMICMGVVIVVKLYFNLAIPLFWVIIPLVGVSYAATKYSEDFVKRIIVKQGLSNWETFWKYYSNQIIYPVWTHHTEELQYLLMRYPELDLMEEERIE